jgi:hypothetical protein
VLHAQQTVAVLAAPVTDGQATFRAGFGPLRWWARWSCTLTSCARRQAGEDTRLVVVDMPQRVAVGRDADQPQYAPGDTAAGANPNLCRRASWQLAPPRSASRGGRIRSSRLDTLPPGFARATSCWKTPRPPRRARCRCRCPALRRTWPPAQPGPARDGGLLAASVWRRVRAGFGGGCAPRAVREP